VPEAVALKRIYSVQQRATLRYSSCIRHGSHDSGQHPRHPWRTVTQEDGGRLNAFASEPRMQVVEAENGWGFHERAEKLNGRMAMLGFIALLATELALGGESFTRGLLGIG